MSQRLYEKYMYENGIIEKSDSNEAKVITESLLAMEEKENKHTFRRMVVGTGYFICTIIILCMIALSSIAIVLLFNPVNRNTIIQLFTNMLHFS